jgi:hypothetical protein
VGIQYEDRTDISGSPQPIRARSPSQVHGDAQQKVNQNRRGPQSQGPFGAIGGALGSLKDKAGELGGDVKGGLDRASQFAQDQGFVTKPTGNPLDWPGEIQRDAGAVFHFARDRYQDYRAFIDPGNISNFIQHNWNTDDAQVRNQPLWQRAYDDVWQNTLRSLTENPGSPLFWATAIQRMRGESEKQAVGEVSGQAISSGLDPLTYIAPESAPLKAAAFVGVPAAEAALTADSNESHADLAWAAISAILLRKGHLPQGMKDFLRQRFGGWGDVEKGLNEAQDVRKKAAETIADPVKHDQSIVDHIQQMLHGVDQEKGPITRENLHKLVEKMPGEPDMRDPGLPLKEITDPEQNSAAHAHLGDLAHLASEVKSELWATHHNPSEQVLRAIAGHTRSLDETFRQYFDSLSKMLGPATKTSQVAMMKAAEGDLEVYQSLSPQERVAVDSWRVLAGVMRDSSADTDYARNFVANYVPRLNEDVAELRQRGRPNKASVLAREARKHRAMVEQLDPVTGHISTVQKYKTVQEANVDLRKSRESLVNHLLDAGQPLRDTLSRSPEAPAIRELLKTDVQQAQHRATLLAQDHYPLLNEQFLQNISRVAPYQAKAILTQKGLNELGKTIIHAERADGTAVRRTAAMRTDGLDERDIKDRIGQGYEAIKDPKFRNWLFDSNVAKHINRYMAQDFSLPAGIEQAARINRQLLRFVMFSPHIHGANIARRYSALSMNHPVEFARYMKQGKALLPAQMDDVSHDLRREAYQSGVLPPRPSGSGWQANFSDLVDAAFQDGGDHVHQFDQPGHSNKLMQVLSAPKHGYESYERGFWRWVSDFGVAAYHIEKQSLVHSGMAEADARMTAARRANTWAGFVAPEDTNVTLQKLMKLGIFAPNWWRTMGELMVPVYKRSGIFENNPQMIKHAVVAGLKTTAAMVAFMKLSGQSLNLMMSGHLQGQNEPGHQDDIEINNPAILHALQKGGLLPDGMNPDTGRNDKNGARMYLRVGGQMEDVLQAAGLESGQPGKPIGPGLNVGPAHLQISAPGDISDVWDGMTKFAAARTSPILNDSLQALNFDLYHFMSGGLSGRSSVPGEQAGHPSPLSVALAAIYALPGGSAFAQSIERNIQQGGSDTTSLFGTKIPTSATDWLKAAGTGGERMALSALLGVNAPYAAAPKSRGLPMADNDYRKVKELTDTYDRQQSAASAAALSGQKSPKWWYDQYRSAFKTHVDQMKALFHDAPQYVNGAEGMANEWETLYDKATDDFGVVDQAKLSELQAQFRQGRTAEQMRSMNSVLKKNRDRTPMLALYHDTLDAYNKWQDGYASKYGIDGAHLRANIGAYNNLKGDAKGQREFLSQHPEMRRYRNAVRTQFDRSTAGILYVLFHGDSKRAMHALQAKHLSMQELESEVQQEAAA